MEALVADTAETNRTYAELKARLITRTRIGFIVLFVPEHGSRFIAEGQLEALGVEAIQLAPNSRITSLTVEDELEAVWSGDISVFHFGFRFDCQHTPSRVSFSIKPCIKKCLLTIRTFVGAA